MTGTVLQRSPDSNEWYLMFKPRPAAQYASSRGITHPAAYVSSLGRAGPNHLQDNLSRLSNAILPCSLDGPIADLTYRFETGLGDYRPSVLLLAALRPSHSAHSGPAPAAKSAQPLWLSIKTACVFCTSPTWDNHTSSVHLRLPAL